MTLADLVGLEDGPRRGLCEWRTGKLDGTDATNEQAAWIVAREAMLERCKGAPAAFDLWHEAATGARTLTPVEWQRVTPFIRTGFGLPGRELPSDHVQG